MPSVAMGGGGGGQSDVKLVFGGSLVLAVGKQSQAR